MVKDARGHVLFASRPQTELTALLSPPSTTTTHDRISTRNTSLQPYLHYLQQISQPSLQPYLPILVTFHSCNTSMQPYTFPLLQTHLCRNDSASARGSLLRSPLLRALHPSHIFTRPLFLEPASILSLPPLLSLPHRPSHLSPTHLQPSPSRIQALRVMADSPVRRALLLELFPSPRELFVTSSTLFKHAASISRHPSNAAAPYRRRSACLPPPSSCFGQVRSPWLPRRTCRRQARRHRLHPMPAVAVPAT